MGREDYGHLYDWRWQQARAAYLAEHPACARCGKPAQVVDHVRPHRGSPTVFWDRANWQPLCKRCHDGPKQRDERIGLRGAFGPDGLPLDGAHHWRQGRGVPKVQE